MTVLLCIVLCTCTNHPPQTKEQRKCKADRNSGLTRERSAVTTRSRFARRTADAISLLEGRQRVLRHLAPRAVQGVRWLVFGAWPRPPGAHVTEVWKSSTVVDIPRAMSGTFGLKSIPAEKSASEIGGHENERSFAKGPHEISCLSDVEIVGLASKTGFGLNRIKRGTLQVR